MTKAQPHLKPLIPVILAGGAGTRLWPLSRAIFPKPCHALFGDRSLLQMTVRRAATATAQPPIVVCNAEHRFLVAEQLRALDLAWRHIVLEPAGRNTAPAIALAAHLAVRDNRDAQLLVLPADHLIDGDVAFADAVKTAATASEGGAIVAFGVTPTRPETGYGYIEVTEARHPGLQPIRGFVEKPARERAERFVAGGRHLWNSGMFVTGANTVLEEIGLHSPVMSDAVARSVRGGGFDLDFFRPADVFLDSPNVSFDVAVMENTGRGKVLPVDFAWNDIGSWKSVHNASRLDENGNHFAGDVLPIDVENTLIHAGHRLVGAVGIDGLVVVETADAVLIADRARAEDVTALVAQLRRSGRTEHQRHTQVFRPWGSYEEVARGKGYLTKRIKIKPGASISLQRHRHRAEHWVVVRGTAEVSRADEVFLLHENQSAYVPIGTTHRLRNVGTAWLEIVEVQVGDLLDEDDIVRFEDQYGRAGDRPQATDAGYKNTPGCLMGTIPRRSSGDASPPTGNA